MNPQPRTAPSPSQPLHLRPAVAADVVFMRRLSREAIADEFPGSSDAYIDLQARTRELMVDSRWPTAVWEIIEYEGGPIGRLLVERKLGTTNIVSIMLARSCRGTGIGTAVLELMVANADADGIDLTLLVDDDNAALFFYRQHGFDEVQVVDHSMLLRRRTRGTRRT